MLTIDGTRTQGKDVRAGNVIAALAVANVVKSSLGPLGLDKMLVDQVGDVTITNDGATILKQLEVEHPAGKVLCELADLQDQEVGDGTTSVVIIASELLKRANELIKGHVHPTNVMTGYRMALREAVRFIKKNLTIPRVNMEDETIIQAAKTSMSSKIIGPESNFFARMAVDAMKAVRTVLPDGSVRYPVRAVNILKSHGRSSMESELVNGYAIANTRAAQGMPSSLKGAKIALLDFNLNRHRLKMGVQILVKDPKQLEAIQQKEIEITHEKIRAILDSGANVVCTTKGIDDLCLKYFVEAGAIGIRRVKKDDIRRLAKATGAQLVLTMADMDGGETFDPSWLGTVEEVVEERIGDNELTYFKGCSQTAAQTIILRGANEFMLDEVDRSLHDSLCVVKRVLESKTLVAGGGAVESSLAVHLTNYAKTIETREQLAIAEFAQSLLIIPRTLAVNAAKDATELIAQLLSEHSEAQKDMSSNAKYTGLDLINGVVRNNFDAGVLEPAISKVKSLRFATEAAVTILRIDDHIKLNPKADPNAPPR